MQTPSRHSATASYARRGSTLLIVMVLLGMLTTLGLFFYSFASQEQSNALYYAEAAKQPDVPKIEFDVLADHAMQQVVVRTDPRLRQSALWGSRHSLIANLVGVGPDGAITDTNMANGRGVNVIPGATAGTPAVDQNRDGMADGAGDLLGPAADQVGFVYPGSYTDYLAATNGAANLTTTDLLKFNDSPSANVVIANGQYYAVERKTHRFPQPDVDYTYPDLNNVFLSMDMMVNPSAGTAPHRAFIPSYHRPQYLRDAGAPFPVVNHEDIAATLPGRRATGLPSTDWRAWYERFETRDRSLRAHPDHVYVPVQPGQAVTKLRYVLTTAEATPLGLSAPFPFRPMANDYTTASPRYLEGRQGIWDETFTSGTPNTFMTEEIPGFTQHHYSGLDYEYDIDTDNDGVRDAILMDLGFPPLEQNVGGVSKLYVPMYAVTIKDLNGLIDLNTHGNVSALYAGPNPATGDLTGIAYNNQTAQFGGASTADSNFISRSNLGLGPAEVNPLWVLNTRPNDVTAAIPGDTGTSNPTAVASLKKQHELFYSAFAQPSPNPTTPGPTPPAATTMPVTPGLSQHFWRELANMELAWIKLGRPRMEGAATPATAAGDFKEAFAGVFGEETLMKHPAINERLNSGSGAFAKFFPRPGISRWSDTGVPIGDDNNDRFEGLYDPLFRRIRKFGFPMDYTGYGSIFSTHDASTNVALVTPNRLAPNLYRPFATSSVQFPRFFRYSDHGSEGASEDLDLSGTGGETVLNTWTKALQALIAGSTTAAIAPSLASISALASIDDSYEVALYSKDRRSDDDPLGPEETAYLQLSNADLKKLGLEGRLKDLAPYNLAADNVVNTRADRVRAKFTTVHNDLKRYSAPMTPKANPKDPAPTDVRAWEWNHDGVSTMQAARKFPPQFGPDGSIIPRYYQETDLDYDNSFAPTTDGALALNDWQQVAWRAFNLNTTPVTAAATVLSGNTNIDSDPFRREVRQLLEQEEFATSRNRLQRKLSLNHVLVPNLRSGQVEFRKFTPHWTDASNPLPATALVPAWVPPAQYPYAATDSLINQRLKQEYWARRDRQQWCRDMYVLLATVATQDATAANSPTQVALNEDVARTIAQFVVNLCDQIDEDDVMTKFEFDINLSNGWNLDDNAYTGDDTATGDAVYPAAYEPTVDRRIAFGTERLQLALSEALVVRANKQLANSPDTDWDDQEHHCFTYVELRNVSPATLSFNPTGDRRPWRLRVDVQNMLAAPDDNPADPNSIGDDLGDNKDRQVVLRFNNALTPGETYTIGSSDEFVAGQTANARMKVTSGSAVDGIIPDSVETDLTKWLNMTTDGLDRLGATPKFEIYDGRPLSVATNYTSNPSQGMLNTDLGSAAPNLLPATVAGTDTNPVEGNPIIVFKLERVQSPYRDYAGTNLQQIRDNPPVTVDQLRVENGRGVQGAGLNFSPPYDVPTMTGDWVTAASHNRADPVSAAFTSSTGLVTAPPTAFRYNTFGRPDPAASDKWQIHFDRDLASLVEMFFTSTLPPQQLTHAIELQSAGGVTVGAPTTPAMAGLAFTDATKQVRGQDQRWYRFLDFVEVQTRTNRGLNIFPSSAATSSTSSSSSLAEVYRKFDESLLITRQPGRLNLNTIRHPEVLAALIDDFRVADFRLGRTSPTTAPTTPLVGPGWTGWGWEDAGSIILAQTLGGSVAGADYWEKFLSSRDASADPVLAAPSKDLLNRVPGALGTKPFRELGFTSRTGSTASINEDLKDTLLRPNLGELGAATTDPYLRQGIQSKIANNVTTRSNSFGVWIAIKFFEAAEDGGAIRIGGPLNGRATPEYRGFYVVDRSLWQPGMSLNERDSFKNFVVHKKVLQQP